MLHSTYTRLLGSLLLSVPLAASAPAQCPTGDDLYEDNDDCLASAVVAPGVTTGLVLYGTAGGSLADHDWFTLGATQLQDGEGLVIEVQTTNGATAVDIDAYRSATPFPGGCPGTAAGTSTGYGTAHPVHNYTNATGAPVYIAWRVDPYSGNSSLDCAEYDLTVTVIPAPCGGPDDAFEDNDSCATGVPLPLGTTTGLQVHGPLFTTGLDFDYWTHTVAPGERLSLELFFEDTYENIDAKLYDVSGGCPGVLLRSAHSATSDEALHWDNIGAVAVPVVLEVVAGQTANSCNDYTLSAVITPSPCVVSDDAFEENDTCATAVPGPTGLTPGLRVFGASCVQDDDYYSYTLAPGDQLSVRALFTDADGNVDIALYDASSGCTGISLRASQTSTDNEELVYDNLSATPLDVVLWVEASDASHEYNTYDLEVLQSPSPCQSDDVLEDNDDCTTAVPVVPGYYPGLTHFALPNLDNDWYRINVPDRETLIVELDLDPVNGKLDIDFKDITTSCPGSYEGTTSGNTTGHVTHRWLNDTGGPAVVAILVDRYTGSYTCKPYDMTVTLLPDLCTADDVFEDNDTCATATLLAPGFYPGLYYYYNLQSSLADEDWYRVTVPGLSDLVVTIDHDHLFGALDLDAFGYCGGFTVGAQAGTGTDVVTLTVTNLGVGASDYFIRVDRQSGTFVCNDYDLNIAVSPTTNPCAGTDDLLEENDDCGSAVPVAYGLTTGLRSLDGDDDFYSVDVPDGVTLQASCYFSNASGNINMRLYDSQFNCVSDTYLDVSSSHNDVETVEWTNNTGVNETLLIRVYLSTANGCNDYDLEVFLTGLGPVTAFCLGDGSDGTATCPCGNAPAPGSGEGCASGTGLGSYLTASGSPSVSNDTLLLAVNQAAPSDFGIFVQNVSSTAGIPFYDGVLCLPIDGHLVRHYSPPVVSPTVTDATGTGTNAQPLTAGDFLGDTTPGATIYYQFWGRDNSGACGSGASFSSGVYLTWLP